MLFDLGARRFYLFGLVLYPQDFIYLTRSCCDLGHTGSVSCSRRWPGGCGVAGACPQTVYTEIFMAVERWFGRRPQARICLDSSPWTLERLARKSGKQAVWIAIGLWTGFTFVGYFHAHPDPGPGGAAPVARARGLLDAVLRICHLWQCRLHARAGLQGLHVLGARFQSAMFDKDTLIISYDVERGEPRGGQVGRRRRNACGGRATASTASCACRSAHGIDIRNGLQYECIGCAACIDVCNGVMDKVGYPRGLIRYDTQNGIAQHLSAGSVGAAFRPRVLIYGSVLVLFCGAGGQPGSAPQRADVVRDRATLAARSRMATSREPLPPAVDERQRAACSVSSVTAQGPAQPRP